MNDTWVPAEFLGCIREYGDVDAIVRVEDEGLFLRRVPLGNVRLLGRSSINLVTVLGEIAKRKK